MTQDRRFPRGSWIQVELQSEILEEIRRPKVRKIERFGTCIADFLEDLGSKKSYKVKSTRKSAGQRCASRRFWLWEREEGRAKKEERRRKTQEEGRTKKEEKSKKKEESRTKTNLYTLTPDHPALLAPYYIIYNL